MEPDEEGTLGRGVPYLKLGSGPPLLAASGLTAEHVNPSGRWRQMSLKWLAPFSDHFTCYLVNRRPDLLPGTRMTQLAQDYADVIEEVGEPVHVHGTSTGGSLALQLAIDHPDKVRRMVVCASACRLSPSGKALQLDVARRTEAGDARGAWGQMMSALAPKPLRFPAWGVGWMVGRLFTADDPTDMLRVIEAEDVFDVEPRLGSITAPTMVQGGTKDVFYDEDLFRRTAEGIPDGQVVIYEGKGHAFVAGSSKTATTALGFLLG